MRHGYPIEPPPRTPRPSPWLEIAAWLLAFAILAAAPCAPERNPAGRERHTAVVQRR